MKTVKLSMDGEGDVWLDLQDAQTGRKAAFNLRRCAPPHDTGLCAEIMGEMLGITFVEPGAPQDGPARIADLEARLATAEARNAELEAEVAQMDVWIKKQLEEASEEVDDKEDEAQFWCEIGAKYESERDALKVEIERLRAEVARLGGVEL